MRFARQIAAARGPSGPNTEYLLELAKALRELGKDDAHVFAIEKHLGELSASQPGMNGSRPRAAR